MFNIILSFYTHAQTHTRNKRKIVESESPKKNIQLSDLTTIQHENSQNNRSTHNSQTNNSTQSHPKMEKVKKNTKIREKCEHLI